MKTIKKLTISTLLAAMLLTSVDAGSVGGFGGSLEVTQWGRFGAETVDRAAAYGKQLEEYALQAQQYQQQIDQYINQFKSYEMMLQNIGQLPQAQWDQFTQSVNGLKDSLSFGEGLAFTASSYDADFSKLFPGYDEYLAGAAGKTTQQNLLDFKAQYKQLNTSTKDTVNGALKALKLRTDDMLTDEGTMRNLSALSTSAAGQKAAIQAANEIALHQTHQLKKLEQTIMAQANMQGEFILQKQEKEELIKAQNDAWYDKANFEKDSSKYKKTTRRL